MRKRTSRILSILLSCVLLLSAPLVSYKKAEAFVIAPVVTTVLYITTALLFSAAGYGMYEIYTKNADGVIEPSPTAKEDLAATRTTWETLEAMATDLVKAGKSVAECVRALLSKSAVQETYQDLRSKDAARYRGNLYPDIMVTIDGVPTLCTILASFTGTGFGNLHRAEVTEPAYLVVPKDADRTPVAKFDSSYALVFYSGVAYVVSVASHKVIDDFALIPADMPRVAFYYKDLISVHTQVVSSGTADAVLWDYVCHNITDVTTDAWRETDAYNYPAFMRNSRDFTRTIPDNVTIDTVIDGINAEGVEKYVGTRELAPDYNPTIDAGDITGDDVLNPDKPDDGTVTTPTTILEWLAWLWDAICGIPAAIGEFFSDILHAILSAVEAIGEWCSNFSLDGLLDVVLAVPAAIFGFFSDILDAILSAIEAIGAWCSGFSLKGILDGIKEIPAAIGEILKSLFIPGDGFFQKNFNDLKNKFSNRFGFGVWEEMFRALKGYCSGKLDFGGYIVLDMWLEGGRLGTVQNYVRGFFYPLLLLANIRFVIWLIRGSSHIAGSVEKGAKE